MVKTNDKSISIRFSEVMLLGTKRVANIKGLKYQTLIKSWVGEKLAEEEAKIEKKAHSTFKTPYFLWDETISEDELKEVLKKGTPHQKYHYISKILREASYNDVWKYLSVSDISKSWDLLKNRLGKKKNFWIFMLDNWRKHGFISKTNFDPSPK